MEAIRKHLEENFLIEVEAVGSARPKLNLIIDAFMNKYGNSIAILNKRVGTFQL